MSETVAQRILLDAIARSDRSTLELLLHSIVMNPDLYHAVADAAKAVGLLRLEVEQNITSLYPAQKRKRHKVTHGLVKHSLSVLATNATAIVSSVLFPFLGVQEHISLASTSHLMLRVGGIRPPACMCVKPETWKKQIKLDPDVTGEKLRQLCLVARPLTLIMRRCCMITDSDLAYLKPLALEELNLSQCTQITDAGLANLQHMPLKNLNLFSSTWITDNGLAILQHMSLTHLSLSGCKSITDAGLAHLQHMPLQELKLAYCELITDAGLANLQGMPLASLCLAGCNLITDAGVAHLQHMPLESLNLRGCALITDAGLAHLQHTPLQFLHLNFCTLITDIGVAH
jgi:hypothetical protein